MEYIFDCPGSSRNDINYTAFFDKDITNVIDMIFMFNIKQKFFKLL